MPFLYTAVLIQANKKYLNTGYNPSGCVVFMVNMHMCLIRRSKLSEKLGDTKRLTYSLTSAVNISTLFTCDFHSAVLINRSVDYINSPPSFFLSFNSASLPFFKFAFLSTTNPAAVS